MKINISVEATPKEIREVFGLPDIQDVQGLFLQRFQQNLQEGRVDKDVLTEMMGPTLQFSKNFMDSMMENMGTILKQSPGMGGFGASEDASGKSSKRPETESEEY